MVVQHFCNKPQYYAHLNYQYLYFDLFDRLRALCDRLEESIEAAKGKQTDLLDALMSRI
jgi:hypothetical protein